MPASYPPAGWELTAVTASGQMDEPATRDFWYYVAFSVDACGRGTVSTMTSGTLNYFLGDVHNGLANCAGDNLVNSADISFLGSHYGAALGDADALGCLDVGPTTTKKVDGRPTTDNRVNFEDLVLFAMNYGRVNVAAEAVANRLEASANSGPSSVKLTVGQTPALGQTFDAVLYFEGSGNVQALSAKLGFNPAVVEPVGVVRGELLDRQSAPADVFSSEPGSVDAAVFGTGEGLAGSGELARVTFRVKAAGDPGITIGTLDARDQANQPVAIEQTTPVEARPTPAQLVLASSYPNPFANTTTVVFGLPRAASVKLVVFDIQGRAVRHLIDGTVSAGWARVMWDGRDDAGRGLQSGAYVIRLAAGERVITRSVRLVR